MDDVLAAWLRLSATASTAFRNYPLTRSYASTNFSGRAVHHGSEPGCWYCMCNQFNGPDHHTQADWDAAIDRALAHYDAERASRPMPTYAPVRPRSCKWWLDDYAGKHGPGTG